MQLYFTQPYYKKFDFVNYNNVTLSYQREEVSYRKRKVVSGNIVIFGKDFDAVIGLDLSIVKFQIVRNGEAFNFIAEFGDDFSISEKRLTLIPKSFDEYTKLLDFQDKEFNIMHIATAAEMRFNRVTDFETIEKSFTKQIRVQNPNYVSPVPRARYDIVTDSVTGAPIEFIDFSELGLDHMIWSTTYADYNIDVSDRLHTRFFENLVDDWLDIKFLITAKFTTQVAYGIYDTEGTRIAPSNEYIYIEDVTINGTIVPKFGKAISYNSELWTNTYALFTDIEIYRTPVPSVNTGEIILYFKKFNYLYAANQTVTMNRGRKLTDVISYIVGQINASLTCSFGALYNKFQGDTLLIFGITDLLPNESGLQKDRKQTNGFLSLQQIFNFLKSDSYLSFDWIVENNVFTVIHLSDYNGFSGSSVIPKLAEHRANYYKIKKIEYTRVKQTTQSITPDFAGYESEFTVPTRNKRLDRSLSTILVDYSYIYANAADFDSLNTRQFVIICAINYTSFFSVTDNNKRLGFRYALENLYSECASEILTLADRTVINVAENRIISDKVHEGFVRVEKLEDISLSDNYSFCGYRAKVLNLNVKEKQSLAKIEIELK